MTRAIEWFREYFIGMENGEPRDAPMPWALIMWPLQVASGLAMIVGVIFLSSLPFLALYYFLEFIRAQE
jgi:hypothetical protein